MSDESSFEISPAFFYTVNEAHTLLNCLDQFGVFLHGLTLVHCISRLQESDSDATQANVQHVVVDHGSSFRQLADYFWHQAWFF